MEIDSIIREDTGRGAAKRMRQSGYVPAILYGDGKVVASLAVEARDIKIKMRDDKFFSTVLTIKHGGRATKALLRDVQMHPHRADILHLDFQSVRDDADITASVPINYINVDICPGVKLHQGIFSTIENQIAIRCLPKDLPESITVDVQNLEIGKSIHISEITAPDGVRFEAISRGEDPVLAVVSEVKETPDTAPASGEEGASDGDSTAS